MELPIKKHKALRENPNFIILYGKPKSGKTTIISKLDDCLHIDLENGSDFFDIMSIKANNLKELYSIKIEIEKKIKENDGKLPYKYIAIDTATKLEELALPLAKKLYNETPMGTNFEGKDVKKLPNGGGYLYLREAFYDILNWFKPLCKCFILIGHVNETLINKDGKEMNEMTIDLTGKLRRTVPADADALGYVYREKNKTIISFEGGEDSITEARPLHLKGKKIVIAESDSSGKITAEWSQIFK